ncbi:DUF1828 domain-containing protein [Lacticaseibacillus paracasei]
MVMNAAALERAYISWLRDKYTFSDLDKNVVKIQTPFLDSEFDDIILYAQSLNNGRIVLTDDGWTIDNLESQGFSFSKRATTRRHLLDEIAISFGVEIDYSTKEISIKTTADTFPEAKHRLLLAIIRANDLSFLSPDNVKSSFSEDVQSLLDENKVLYTPSILIPSYQGLAVHFDFSIPIPEGNQKLVRTISYPNNLNNMKIANYDINLASRTRKSRYVVVLNDIKRPLTNRPLLEKMADDSDYPFRLHSYSEIKKDPTILANVS